MIHRKPQQGSALIIIVIIVAFLVILQAALGFFNNTAATHVVMDRRHLQAYYAAKAGLNEAVGTRMIPRTNFLSFSSPQNALYRLSGVVRQDPQDINSPILGIYRYFILGGDESRDGNSGNYFADYRDFVNPASYNQDFYIISQGSICVDANNNLAPGIVKPTGGAAPQCSNPATQKRIDVTLIASADLTRNKNTTKDQVGDFTLVNNPNSIALPHPAFAPGSGVTSTVNFQNTWSNLSAATPTHVVIQNATSIASPANSTGCSEPRAANANCIYGRAISGPATTISPSQFTLHPTDVIEVFFDQPIDYRSFYIGLTDNNGQPSQVYQFDSLKTRCFNDLAFCRISFNNTGNYPATLIPFLPSATGIRIYPPTNDSKRLPAGQYTLTLMQMTNYKGVVSPNYTIQFSLSGT